MTRVVFDTNIIVSAALKAGGNEAAVLHLVAEGRVMLCATPAILAEYAEVLSRPRLRIDPLDAQRLVEAIQTAAVLVRPTRRLRISPDEADNRFLECAEASEADFLVTGNLRHFPPQWATARTVNSRGLLAVFGRRGGRAVP